MEFNQRHGIVSTVPFLLLLRNSLRHLLYLAEVGGHPVRVQAAGFAHTQSNKNLAFGGQAGSVAAL